MRAALFNIAFYANLIVWLTICLPAIALPRPAVVVLLRNWARSSLWLLRIIVGMRLEARGLERLAPGPLLVASKHQSLFETFALVPFLADPAYVLKRELNWIPLFGWWSMKFRMIPVRRGGGGTARARLVADATRELAAGRQIIIFPEGTRRTPGAKPAYKGGIGFLYEACGVPCQPVALNSGLFWPRRQWTRRAGTVVIEFLDPIPPGMEREAFMDLLETRVETASAGLLAQSRLNGR